MKEFKKENLVKWFEENKWGLAICISSMICGYLICKKARSKGVNDAVDMILGMDMYNHDWMTKTLYAMSQEHSQKKQEYLIEAGKKTFAKLEERGLIHFN